MPTIRPAVPDDLVELTRFVAEQLGGEGGPERYRRYFDYPWLRDKPNLGYVIEIDGRIRGFIGGIYAERRVRGEDRKFCNLTSICVDDSARKHSLSMFKRMLDQPGYTFTSFSPTDRVAEILAFFKFQRLPQDKLVFTPVAGWSRRRRGTVVLAGPRVERELDPDDRTIFRDHAGYRCGHFLVERGGARSYLVTARRGRGVRVFADVLHASNPGLAIECVAHLHGPVARAHRTALIGFDQRWLAERPFGSFRYTKLRPRMVRPVGIGLDDVDGLYSEFIPMYG